jgi:hypothetical protein
MVSDPLDLSIRESQYTAGRPHCVPGSPVGTFSSWWKWQGESSSSSTSGMGNNSSSRGIREVRDLELAVRPANRGRKPPAGGMGHSLTFRADIFGNRAEHSSGLWRAPMESTVASVLLQLATPSIEQIGEFDSLSLPKLGVLWVTNVRYRTT